MENAVEALMLAFAVMMLVLALSLTIYVFSQARQTSELMLKLSDPTEYYEYYDYYSRDTNDALGNRIVGIETVIPTLYKYSKERYKVTFRKGSIVQEEPITDENGDTVQLIKVEVGDPIEIYETTTDPTIDWSQSYTNDFDNTRTTKKICSFDIDDEVKRGECWTADVKNHLDVMISGGLYLKPQYNDKNISDLNQDEKDIYTINYGNGLLERFKNQKFVEIVGEVANKKTGEAGDEIDENEGITGNKTTTKKVITYVLINN